VSQGSGLVSVKGSGLGWCPAKGWAMGSCLVRGSGWGLCPVMGLAMG
jgi:hypothetical protein